MVKKSITKMFVYRSRTKLSILISAVTLAAVILMIYSTDSINYEISARSLAFDDRREIPKVLRDHERTDHGPLRSSVGHVHVQLRSMQEESDHDHDHEVDDENWNLLVPPVNVREGERIAWLRQQLPKFEIFKSNNITRLFHGRVLEFFNRDCEVRFFMTWISPAGSFGRREFLAMESLFKAHPRGCLMILSRSMDSRRGNRILKPLHDRGFKVNAVTPDLPFLFKNTPAKAWFNEMKRGKKDPGEIPLAQNLSNLLRLAVLYKYGGVYMDTDFILLKPLSGMRNSIGAQSMDMESKSWTRLNNAVLVFDMNHPLLLRFMEEFARTFDGNKWGHNGPYLVSRVVERVGKRPGYHFVVLPPMAFYPVDWNKIGRLFKKPKNRAESRWVNGKLLQLSGETYGIHLWNRQTSRLIIEEGSVMGRLISDHCVICKQIYSS
ncbi:uncharacterized protein LOC133852864 [Alnus glutinosa]|uniref:uncharacterized protein LOC133852864 n=1 Tax=Alnus glutinosa TaxID=3517 RepID=UPI002D78EB4E|nr:uncharacterized protein LOC133852864 [Alnus glutinosa]